MNKIFISFCFLSLSLWADKPNVLLIMIDDLSTGNYLKNGKTAMPNLQGFAESGLTYNRAYCQAPLCGPSRASIMTGLYPHTTGIYGHINDDDIKQKISRPQLRFLPEYFADHGYFTLGKGKVFHRGAAEGAFHEYGGMPGNGKTCFGPAPKKRLNWPGPGKVSKGTLTDWGPYAEDQDQPDTWAVDWAAERLKKEYEQPFFMAVGFVKPHVPWHVSEKWYELFPLEDIQLPAYLEGDAKDIPKASQKVNSVPAYPTTEWAKKNNQWKPILQSYLACSAFVDSCLGRVLKALKESPHSENTIVIIASDHGYHLGEKNRFAKMSLWNESSRVPLYVSGPGIRSGVSSKIVSLIDLYPTLVDYCDLPKNQTNEGKSFTASFSSPANAPEDYALCSMSPKDNSVSQGNYRYYRYHDGSEELYDLDKDLHEWHNLALNPETQPLREKLRDLLPKTSVKPVSSMHHNQHFKSKKH